MIVGIGCDIVKISRMSKIVPVFKQSMRQHILSPVEQQELNAQDLNDDKISHFLAKRFAAKEAFSKALGTGFIDGLYMRDITIRHDKLGCPYLEVENGALKALLARVDNQDYQMHLSLSDDADLAQAFVIIERL